MPQILLIPHYIHRSYLLCTYKRIILFLMSIHLQIVYFIEFDIISEGDFKN